MENGTRGRLRDKYDIRKGPYSPTYWTIGAFSLFGRDADT